MAFKKDDAARSVYVCSAICLVLLLTRLTVARIRFKKFDRASIFVVLSLAALTIRLCTDHYYLEYGTAAAYYFDKEPPELSTSKLNQIKEGSILILVSRSFLTTFYWLQICLLVLFYSVMLRAVLWKWLIPVTWVAVGATYIVCMMLTFSDCRPFRLYWQVYPHPDFCVLAFAQLLSQGICCIVLDCWLLALASPLAFVQHSSFSQRVKVAILYVLGCFATVVAILRIVFLYANRSPTYAPMRSFWASIQMAVYCFVANAPTIYGCVAVVKRQKTDQKTRRLSRPEIWSTPRVSADLSTMSRVPEDIEPVQTRQTENEHEELDEEKAIARHIP